MLRVLLVAAIVYVGISALMALFQNQLIYYPSRASASELEKMARGLGMEPWRDANGEIIGWNSKNAAAANRLLIFHGNAGYALHRFYFVEGFTRVGGGNVWQVFVFEYPGYGARSGSPNEGEFKSAAEAAVVRMIEADERPIFLLGESIGAGVACHLAGEYPEKIAGLVLITPFPKLADVAAHHYPLLPVRLLLGNAYNCAEDLRKYRGPAAFLLAGRDEIIPSELGRALYESYAGPKKLWVQERARHNDLDYSPQAPWWQELTEYFSKK